MVACGALALVVSGGLSLPLAALFGVLMIAAWKLEENNPGDVLLSHTATRAVPSAPRG